MLNFTPIQYLILAISGGILFTYQVHYNNSLLYSKGKRRYISTIGFGLAAVGIALELQIRFLTIGPEESSLANSFFYSAFLEELVKLGFILIIFWYNKIRDVLYDGVYYGILLGASFGFVENLIFTTELSFWSMILRSFTSSILHLINGGIAGYFCMKFLFTKGSYKYKYILEGFLICYLVHGIYNYSAFLGGKFLLLLPPILVANFILLEFISAYSKSCLPKFTLDLIQLSIQDYELIRRYTKYEFWLHNEQKLEKKEIPLFQSITQKKSIFILLFLFIAISFGLYFIFFSILKTTLFKEISIYEYLSIFILYPIVISLSIFFAGLVNPEFFKKQVLGVPLISVVNIESKEYKETSIVFFISTYGFYVPLLNPEKLDEEVKLNFLIGSKEFKNLDGKVTWINQNKDKYSKTKISISGALIRFKSYPLRLVYYWKWASFTHRYSNLTKIIRTIQ